MRTPSPLTLLSFAVCLASATLLFWLNSRMILPWGVADLAYGTGWEGLAATILGLPAIVAGLIAAFKPSRRASAVHGISVGALLAGGIGIVAYMALRIQYALRYEVLPPVDDEYIFPTYMCGLTIVFGLAVFATLLAVTRDWLRPDHTADDPVG